MSVEVPGHTKSPLERFSDASDVTRESALQLAAWRHSNMVNPNLSDDEQAQIVTHIGSAIAQKREVERGLRLSSGRQLQQVGGPTILNSAMGIVSQAEHVVAERFEHAWAANIAPKNASHDLVEEIASILDAKNPIQAFRSARVNSAHIQRMSERDALSVLDGISLFGTLPHGSLIDEEEVEELVEHWNSAYLPPTRTPPDIPGRNTQDDEAYAKQMIKGQKALQSHITRAPSIKREFNDNELWALAEYYGEVKNAWRKKRASKRFGRNMPAIEPLVAKINTLIGPKPEGRLSRWLRGKDEGKALADVAYGRAKIRPAVLQILEAHWTGPEKDKINTYLRIWAQQVRGGGLSLRPTAEDRAIYDEGQRVLASAERSAKASKKNERIKKQVTGRAPEPAAQPAKLSSHEPPRALPQAEIDHLAEADAILRKYE